MGMKTLESVSNKEFKSHRDKIHTLGWNCDGKKLASGSTDQTVRIYQPERSLKDLELRGHTHNVDALVWHPSHPDKLCTVSLDKTCKIWDTRSHRPLVHTLQTPGENLNVSWSHDGNYIAIGNKEDVLTLVDVRNNYAQESRKMDVELNESGWNLTNDLFFMSLGKGGMGLCRIYEFPSFQLLHEIPAHTSSVQCLEFDPKGRYFALGASDALVSLWDMYELTCIKTFGKLDWPIRSISISFDGEYIASGSEENIDISHIESGETVLTIKCPGSTNSLAFHPSKYILAYAGDDKDRYGRSDGSVKLKYFKVSRQ